MNPLFWNITLADWTLLVFLALTWWDLEKMRSRILKIEEAIECIGE